VKASFLFLLAIGGAAMGAVLDDGDMPQNAARQEQIRGEVQLLVTRLDEVIDEYARNGLAGGQDFQSLKDVRAALGSLSDEEMEQVVGILRQAAGNPGEVAKAYAGQKDISLRLKQILAAHQRQQDIDDLAKTVRELADRQSANLSTAIDSQQLAAQDNSANGQAAVTASQQAQQSEQESIAGEVKLVSGKLSQVAADGKYKAAATELAAVPPEALAAAGALGGGWINNAITDEKEARQRLEDVALALASASGQETGASQQAAQLADLARQQRALLTQTAQLSAALKKITDAESPEAADKAMYDQLKQPSFAKALADGGLTHSSPADQIRSIPAMKSFLDARAAALKRQELALQAQLTPLAATQAALSAKTQMVQEDLQNTAKEAAASTASAVTRMTSAQEALAAGDGAQAAQHESDAASQLDQAQRLAAPSGTAPSQAATPAGLQLPQMQNAVNALTARETLALQQGNSKKTGPPATAAAKQQADMAAKAQALQQAAAQAGASPAAQALQGAADALQSAAQGMQGGTGAEEAEEAALQNLAQAGKLLADQAAAIAQGKQELANLQKQMAGLGKTIQAQQQLGLDTEKAADKAKASIPKAKQLAARQEGVRKDTQNMRQGVETGMPDVEKALDDADAAMGDAAQKLTGGGGEQAEPSQQAALGALYRAQDALANRMRTLAQGLGQPPAQGRVAAMAALGKAQAQTASAQDAMASGPAAAMPHAATQLAQAARTLAGAGSLLPAIPQVARDAMRAAEQALAGAAASAGAGEGQQAQAQAGQAGQAMAAAQSAMGEAQAGIAGLGPASGAPGAASAQQSSGQAQAGAAGLASTPGAQDASAGQQSGQSGPGPNSGSSQTGATGASEKSWNDQAGAAKAAAQDAQGTGQFLGLPDRDRAALQQSQSEKYPQEYGSMVEEYMRSLASDSGGK
jgi:hypothetical protein